MTTPTYRPPAMAGGMPPPAQVYNAPQARHPKTVPAGTFASGTRIQVGSHKIIIERYLSEGGFAHVYLVKLVSASADTSGVAVLKRVAVPDRDALTNMRTEVETMKKLKGHRFIVTYIDSHASQLKGGGYEVFLLMEYCSGGGLIDFMNTRLQNRLTEAEALKIFSDVAEGVACMHYLKPPLLHRDLKVENILISSSSSGAIRYKLCDFGSAAPPRPAPRTVVECRLIEDDVQKHTTLQYRSPEMVDVYRKQSIDEKSDIWALGVLLYKLCYYTTPFEEQGQLAILNASFKFPSYPVFSDKIKMLIASMLKEDPAQRPNIYQVMKDVCRMRNKHLPLKDIYSNRSESETRRNQRMPSTEPSTSSPAIIGAVQTDTVQQAPCIPEITPMRRGRPTSSTQSNAVHKPSPSPLRNVVSDPFAALDSKSSTAAQTRAKDELSSRFPTLDQFSLLHEPGRKFDFDSTSATSPPSNDLSQRVTEKLADDAFAQPLTHVASAPTSTKPSGGSTGLGISSLTASRQETTGDSPIIHQPTPQRPGRRSQEGEQASFSPNDGSIAAITSRKIYRFPAADQDRSSSKANTEDEDPSRLSTPWSDPWSGPSLYVRPESNSLSGRSLADNHRSKSQTATLPKSPSSSRPSLEGNQPSSLEIENMTNRSKSANSRPRPSSVYLDLHSESRNEKSSSSRRSDPVSAGNPRQSEQSSDIAIDDSNISSDMDYLKAVEGEGLSRRRSGRGSSGSRHRKMGSLPSISLSNAKTLLAGKFGEAFRRFETNTGNEESENRSASPDHARGGLSPIAGSGSHMTSDRSDDGMFGSDAEDVPPEMRRELERRRLSQEERRVAAAGAEYRQRLDKSSDSGRARASGGLTRAKSIQHTVKSLLNETNKPSPTKAAEGYGRFTDRGSSARGGPSESTNNVGVGSPTAPVFRKPLPLPKDDPPLASFTQPPRASSLTYGKTRQHLPQQSIQQKALPPSAPPKPRLLRKGGSDDLSKNSTSTSTSTSISNDTINLSSSPTAAKPTFLAGRPLPPKPSTEGPQSPNGAEDWEKDFSKRYPSLSGLEMVERDITKRSGTGKSVTTRDI